MTGRKKVRKLIVGNPTNVPAGVPVLSFRDGPDFFEGDRFIPRPETTEEIIQRRIKEGFLIET